MLFGQEHVDRYQATDGEEGHEWKGTTALLLTTTGNRSGEERTTPLIYQEHDGDYLVVASKGGADNPPAWFKNLEATPTVGVQIWGEKFTANARVATPDEKPAMWEKKTAAWPQYDDYQKKTDREIPVVVLERA
jgi:deazaflavin-dependent oxidoreductase (nitroreductase family)